jgi:hypothetical protein
MRRFSRCENEPNAYNCLSGTTSQTLYASVGKINAFQRQGHFDRHRYLHDANVQMGTVRVTHTERHVFEIVEQRHCLRVAWLRWFHGVVIWRVDCVA